MSSLVINGDTSGSITLAAPAVAGSSTITLPTTGGTIRTTTTPGAVLQVVQATTRTATSTTSSTYISTGFSASITPTSSSNKILVFINIPVYVLTAGGQSTITVYRGSTNLALAGGPEQAFGQVYTNGGALQGVITACYLDSPATTSSTTYTIYQGSTNVGSTVGICTNNTTAAITLQEIAA